MKRANRVVCLVLAVLLLVTMMSGCSKNELIRNVSWGMNVVTVARKERQQDDEHGECTQVENEYHVPGATVYDLKCDITYDFQDDALRGIVLAYTANDITYWQLDQNLSKIFGEPDDTYNSPEGSTQVTQSKTWYEDGNTYLLTYATYKGNGILNLTISPTNPEAE